MPTAISGRRRIAVVDGASRHELVTPPDALLDDILAAIGLELRPGVQMLVGPGGRQVPTATPVRDHDDGAVFSVVDLSVASRTTGGPAGTRSGQPGNGAAGWWYLGCAGVLAAAVIVLAPAGTPDAARVTLAVFLGLGAIATSVAWTVRERRATRAGAAALLGPLALAFAAGTAIVPPLPDAADVAVLVGFLAAAVIAALAGLVVHAGSLRAELSMAFTVLMGLAAVWGVSLVLGLPPASASAICLGAVPVALRALPSLLLDIAPGMLIDYERFLRLRWSVRQQIPEPAAPVTLDGVRDLVSESSARLVVGTALLCLLAASFAPFALGLGSADPVVFTARICLAVAVVLALALGARRASDRLLRWTPRFAAGAVAVAAVVSETRVAGSGWLALGAVLVFVAAVAAGGLTAPISRGLTSLFWSRFCDVVEGLAVALAFPAGLVSAGILDVVRGVMAQ